MRQHIEFDLKGILHELDVLEKVQLPYAANRALKDFGFYAKRFLGEEMRKEFDNPVPFTTRSPYFKMGDMEVSVGISDWAPKGRSPAEYLEPMIREPGVGRKQQRVTRFAGALQRQGITYGIPSPNRQAAAAILNQFGNIRPSQYTQALGGLGALSMAGASRNRNGRWFVIQPDSQSHLSPGIYRAKGADLSNVWSLASAPKAVTPKFDFYGLVREEAEDQLPGMLSKRLNQALGGS